MKKIFLLLILMMLLVILPAGVFAAEETADIDFWIAWHDDWDAFKMRPSLPTIELYDGDQLVATADEFFWDSMVQEYYYVVATNQFDGLPRYNSNGEKIIYKVKAPEFENYTCTIDEGTNQFVVHYTLNPIDIPVKIIWDDENNKDGIRPDSVQINLYSLCNSLDDSVEQTVRQEDNWEYVFRKLPQMAEPLSEDHSIYYSLGVETPTGYLQTVTGSRWDGYTISFTRFPDIPVKVVWNDENDKHGVRPEDVWVELKVTDAEGWGTYIEEWLSAECNWQGSFPVMNEISSYPVAFNVTARQVYDYSSSVTEQDGGFIVTYTYDPWPRTEIPAKIVWNDNNDSAGARPDEVTLYLQESYEEEGETYWDYVQDETFSAESNWERTFVIVSATSSSNKNYRISAPDIEDYSKTVTNENGKWIVTYTYAPTPKKLVPVEAFWDHKNNPREEWPDEAEIELWIYYVEGEETSKFASIYAESGWKHTFRVSIDPDYNVSPTFSLSAHTVADYDSTVTRTDDGLGFVVTYTYNPAPKTRIPVEIVWDDGDDRDGIRPEEVWVDLYVQVDEMDSIFTEYVKSSTLSAENGWKRTIVFTTISTYIEDTYTVDHEQVTGYESNCVKKDGGFVITFTHKPIKATENPPAPPVPPVPPAAGGTVDNFSAPPKTGDASRLMLWSSLLIVSAAALAGCILLPRKKRDA